MVYAGSMKNAANTPDHKQCPTCKEVKERAEFYANSARHDGLAPTCRVCHTTDTAARQARWREAAFDRTGSKCVHCGYDDRRALTFDHVDGGGGAHRKTLPSPSFYKQIAEGKCDVNVQVLCHNCNHIKRIENREHTGPRLTVNI